LAVWEHRIISAFPSFHSCFAWLAAAVLFCGAAPVAAFDFGDVIQVAAELAGRPYRPRGEPLPEELRKLTFAQHQAIRFKPERALWHRAGTQFEVGLVHMGMSYDQPVTINELSSDGVRRLAFSPDLFHYGSLKLAALKSPPELGFAGFRVLYPLNGRNGKDEALVFLGASYFRAVAEGQRLGLSARGLAIDTAESSGEEFPRFVEFWINRPAPSDRELVIYALLDSRSVTGAYRFVLRPGAPTRMDVRARLYLRQKVTKLGIAPLTSMYLHGENQPPAAGTPRPEVHDSDGLSVRAASGEWLWRPLQNPRRLLVTSYGQNDPLGFGLLQRDRSFRSYEDLDARFELRPGAWVEPRGRWGAGRIELVQIPSPDETNDNIVAYWTPAQLPATRKPFDVEYQLLWDRESQLPAPSIRVAQTRRVILPAAERREKPPEKTVSFVIDFEQDPAVKLPKDLPVQWIVSGSDNAEIVERTLRRHEAMGGWRASVRIRILDEKRPVELRGQLNAERVALSEVWSYVIPPE
jgi:glucans biosynthesis protein